MIPVHIVYRIYYRSDNDKRGGGVVNNHTYNKTLRKNIEKKHGVTVYKVTKVTYGTGPTQREKIPV